MIVFIVSEINKTASKHFITNFCQFTNKSYDVAPKAKLLFKVKDRNLNSSCKIFKGECICGETYVGEIVRNVEVRWTEHNNINIHFS